MRTKIKQYTKKQTNKEKDTKHLAKHTTLLKYVYFMITIKLCF